jgi:H+/Cl- antiporter ClcA
MTEGEPPPEPDPAAIMGQRSFLALLVLAAVVGVVASLGAWLFLEAVNLVQTGVFDDLPDLLGFDDAPTWWPLPVLAVAGLIVGLAIERLPGRGGHLPANGLNPQPTLPRDLPGVMLAAVAGIGLGVVLGPEAPLMALGGALGAMVIRAVRSDAPPEAGVLMASAGVFAALSFLFGSPLIAAVLVIEAAAIGGSRLPVVLIPGLLAAGIGMLISIGLGSWTGVDTSNISLELLPMPTFDRPDAVEFLWSVPLAFAVAVVAFAIFTIGKGVARRAEARPVPAAIVVGVLVAGLAILFELVTDKGSDQVLFSGQDAIGPLIANAGTWSLGALLALIACKGLAYALALGSFRGGPVFPALFLAAAAGLAVAGLPGFSTTPAVAVAMGAAMAAILRLPLSAAVLATLLTSKGGLGADPLIIVGVVVAYLTALWLAKLRPDPAEPAAATN